MTVVAGALKPVPARRAPTPSRRPLRASWSLTVIFVGLALYAAFGKGFSYAGYPPLFVGEVLLVLVLVSAVRPSMPIPRHPAALIALGLVVLAAVQALVDRAVGTAALLETLRGLAPLYYAVYAFGIYALLRRLERRRGRAAVMAVVERGVRRAAPGVTIALFLLAGLLVVQPTGLLTWPGSGVRILFTKATDISVALAMLVPVMMGRRADAGAFPGTARPREAAWIWRLVMLVWAGAVLLAVCRSRGALLALAAGTFAMRPRPTRVLKGLIGAGSILVALYVAGVSIELEYGRKVDARSAVESVVSVFGSPSADQGGSNYVDTRNWRSDWWSRIWSDAMDNQMVLHGRGWGDNLAVRHGVVPTRLADNPLVLRLPHSVFFSLVGRAGVVVAVGFMAVPLLTVARSFSARQRAPDSMVVEMARAGVVAGSAVALTDVYFESPQGGVLLWSLLGLMWWSQAPDVDRPGRALPADERPAARVPDDHAPRRARGRAVVEVGG